MMLARKTEACAALPEVVVVGVVDLMTSFRRLRLEREMVRMGLSFERRMGRRRGVVLLVAVDGRAVGLGSEV